MAESKTGYFGVTLAKPGQPKPYQAQVWRGGKNVHLGAFATAEEAALCIAQSPEGQAAAQRAAAAPVPLTSVEARQQAQAEGLTLRLSESKAGYAGVSLDQRDSSRLKPYQAHVKRSGKKVHLGAFATAEEAALCVAQSPEGQAAAQRVAAAPVPLTSVEARQQAQAEGLTLRLAENQVGYFGVIFDTSSHAKHYRVQMKRSGKKVHLGSFATAEEAALCVARSPEGQVAAGRAALAVSQGTPPAVPSGAILKEEDTAPPMPPSTFVKEEGAVPPMPPDAFVKVEVVVKEEECSDGRPRSKKRRPTK